MPPLERPFWIALDQNAISMLARAETPFWASMRDRLIEGADRGELACPIPKETIVETLGCRPETRVLIRDLSMQLSKGGIYKGYFELLSEETLALVRPRPLGVTIPVTIGIWNDGISNKQVVNETKKALKEWKLSAEQRASQILENYPQKSLTIEECREYLSLSRAQAIYKQIQRIKSGKPPNPKELLVEVGSYLEANTISPEELNRLEAAVMDRTWNRIPLLAMHTALSAVAEQEMSAGGKTCKPRPYRANDELDRSRLAIGVAYADLVITENSLATVARQTGLPELLAVTVLGVSEQAEIEKGVQALAQS